MLSLQPNLKIPGKFQKQNEILNQVYVHYVWAKMKIIFHFYIWQKKSKGYSIHTTGIVIFVTTNVAEPHHVNAAPAPWRKNNAAPTTILWLIFLAKNVFHYWCVPAPQDWSFQLKLKSLMQLNIFANYLVILTGHFHEKCLWVITFNYSLDQN
jgi:hypothetical protein